MAKEEKSNRKFWIIGIITLIIIVGVIYYFSNYESMWSVLDNYDDRMLNCSADLSTSMSALDWNSASYQVTTCKNIVNEALLKINQWYRDTPEDREVITAKLDYEATANVYDFYKILINLNKNQYSKVEIYQQQLMAIGLIDKTLQNIDTITFSYSDTQYYNRYYRIREADIQTYREILFNFKDQIGQRINQTLTCPSGQVLGDDLYCYPQCGSAKEYCKEGACCNGKCYLCPAGYSLATDCKCYSN
jgi:hypothetical protein